MSTQNPPLEGRVDLALEDAVAWVTFNRPQARNAMTWAMYEQLANICAQLKQSSQVRVVLFRGAGDEAFVAGTDIAQFLQFGATGDAGADGLAYEQRIDETLHHFATLPMPTVALIEGWAVGGGLALAAGCDFRIGTPSARFGVPIARTLGNCLAMANVARLVSAFGEQRIKRMLMLAEIVGAEEAHTCGFLHEIRPADQIESAGRELAQRLAALAPVTQRVTKESLRRLVKHRLPNDEDLIRLTYGSADFREGVEAFVAKRPPRWQGR